MAGSRPFTLKHHRTWEMIVIALLLTFLIYTGTCAEVTSWVIISRSGNWEDVSPNHLATALDSLPAEVQLRASHIKLGYYRTTLKIDLSGSGKTIFGEICFEIKEINFKIIYREVYKPGFLGLGDYINNTLIVLAGSDRYVLTGHAESPFNSRLNTRLYLWIWRSSLDRISWVLSDAYMQKSGVNHIYLNGSISYDGQDLTLDLSVKKWVQNGQGRLVAYLVYNEIDSSGTVFEDFKLTTLDYGFNSFFYASLSLFIVVIIGQVLHKILLRELGIGTRSVAQQRKVTKRSRRSAR